MWCFNFVRPKAMKLVATVLPVVCRFQRRVFVDRWIYHYRLIDAYRFALLNFVGF
jgi:hypothetical protein